MQLSQVPLDGQKYDVMATITNLNDSGKPVGQKGYLLQKFDLADASKAVQGVAYFYAGNQPDMALPVAWNGQTMNISVSAKQNGQYTNYTASIPQGSGAQMGGNQAHQAPIQQAMAGAGVQYQQPAQAVNTSTAYQQGQSAAQQQTVKQDPDWDEIARGKVRCNLICAILQNSAIDSSNSTAVKGIAQEYMDYIFTGRIEEGGFPDQINYQG